MHSDTDALGKCDNTYCEVDVSMPHNQSDSSHCEVNVTSQYDECDSTHSEVDASK